MRLKDDQPLAFKEATRYLTNAADLLRKAGRANGNYKDKKYVQLAGHAAWLGVLIALDYYLESKGVTIAKERKSKRWYSNQLSRHSRKLNTAFINAYEGLHLHLGYDGAGLVKSVQAYLAEGQKVIELCRKG